MSVTWQQIEGLMVFYWPRFDMILLEGFDDVPGWYAYGFIRKRRETQEFWITHVPTNHELVHIGVL